MEWSKNKKRETKLFRDYCNKDEQKKAEKLLSRYFLLPDMIDTAENTEDIKLTPSYELREGSAYLPPSSKVENAVLKSDRYYENVETFKKLDRLYHAMPPHLKEIWDVRYYPKNMHSCETAMIQLHTSDRNSYFKRKFELIGYVLDAFDLWED